MCACEDVRVFVRVCWGCSIACASRCTSSKRASGSLPANLRAVTASNICACAVGPALARIVARPAAAAGRWPSGAALWTRTDRPLVVRPYRAGRDTVPHPIPCRAEYRAQGCAVAVHRRSRPEPIACWGPVAAARRRSSHSTRTTTQGAPGQRPAECPGQYSHAHPRTARACDVAGCTPRALHLRLPPRGWHTSRAAPCTAAAAACVRQRGDGVRRRGCGVRRALVSLRRARHELEHRRAGRRDRDAQAGSGFTAVTGIPGAGVPEWLPPPSPLPPYG